MKTTIPVRDTRDQRQNDLEGDNAKIKDTRITSVLVLVLILIGCCFDVWTSHPAIFELWSVRAPLTAIVALVLASTYRPIFLRHYGLITAVAYVVFTFTIVSTVVLTPVSEPVRNVHFAGIILIITGIFTWVHLPIRKTSLLVAVIIAIYCSTVFFEFQNSPNASITVFAGQIFYVIAATFIGVVIQSVRLRYISENKRLRSALEQDLESKELARKQSEFAANHDRLTGLPNRAKLETRTAELIADAGSHGNRLALFFLDLNGFKSINDNQGHLVGDDVLKLVAARLKHSFRDQDIVARLGGDEFVIVAPMQASDGSITGKLEQKINGAVSLPVQIGERSFSISASVGVAHYPTDGGNLIRLLQIADERMYAAKHGRNSNIQIVSLQTFSVG